MTSGAIAIKSDRKWVLCVGLSYDTPVFVQHGFNMAKSAGMSVCCHWIGQSSGFLARHLWPLKGTLLLFHAHMKFKYYEISYRIREFDLDLASFKFSVISSRFFFSASPANSFESSCCTQLCHCKNQLILRHSEFWVGLLVVEQVEECVIEKNMNTNDHRLKQGLTVSALLLISRWSEGIKRNVYDSGNFDNCMWK